MSNAQRQREFLERHPGYYRRFRARRKAKMRAYVAELAAKAQAQIAHREPLMLPAPVEMIEIPGMTTIGAIPAREPVMLQVVAANPLESKGRIETRGR
jgi:hypothetical protein